MRVRGVASDPKLGGRDLDKLLVEKLGEEFKKKFGCDYKTNQRAEGKLKDACEKAKKVLTTGATAAQVARNYHQIIISPTSPIFETGKNRVFHGRNRRERGL